MKVLISECEHDGDLRVCGETIQSCGAILISRSFDEESEEGIIEFMVRENEKEFMEKLKKTSIYEFCEFI